MTQNKVTPNPTNSNIDNKSTSTLIVNGYRNDSKNIKSPPTQIKLLIKF